MKNQIRTGSLHNCQPFTGDLTRQNQLNRSVDTILRKQRIAEIRRNMAPGIKKTGTALCILLIGAAYGLILGAQA